MSADALADLVAAATFQALGVDATWQPMMGAARTVRLVPRSGDRLLAGLAGGQQVHHGLLAEVAASALPTGSPAEGDALIVGECRYRVRSARFAEPTQSIWLIDAVPE